MSVTNLFPAPEGDEACRGEGGAGPGGVCEGDERPAVLEAVPAAAAGGGRLRRGQDAQRLDGALPPAQHLLRLPVHRQQPHLIYIGDERVRFVSSYFLSYLRFL